MEENKSDIQTIYSSRLLTIDLLVADTRDGNLSTRTQIDISKPLLENFPNTMFSFLELSKNTMTIIRTYISCFISNRTSESKTDDSLTAIFLDYSKIHGREVMLKLKY